MFKTGFLFLLFLSLISAEEIQYTVDPNGYVLYCPCMGRFGNQVEHFLGTLAFAKALNRSLGLPTWVGTPFKEFFQLEPLAAYHRVIPNEEFMHQIAPKIWPPQSRIGFCYGALKHCKMKESEPSTGFWNALNVNFVKVLSYTEAGLSFYLDYPREVGHAWKTTFPPDKYPVLAFRGAPAPFPVIKKHERLQKYLKWQPSIEQPAKEFIHVHLGSRQFLGIHLRNNVDWIEQMSISSNIPVVEKEKSPNVCTTISPQWHIFDSRQCLGDNFEHGNMTKEICMQSDEAITRQVRSTVLRTGLRQVFVASEVDHMIPKLQAALHDIPNMLITHREPDNPQISLCILAKATLYIGNCLSTFATFVRRERDVYGLPTEFWGMNYATPGVVKSEL